MGKSILVKTIQLFLEFFLIYSCRLQSPAWEQGSLPLPLSLGLGTEGKREERSEKEEELEMRRGVKLVSKPGIASQKSVSILEPQNVTLLDKAL